MKKSQTRRAQPSGDRRTELLALGRTLFSASAYDELGIDEIAARAGVAKGLLYYYFGNKRGFYVAVIEQAADELRERVEDDASLPAGERLARGLDAYLAYAEESPQGYRALMAGGIGADPAVRGIVERERERFLGLIADGLDAEPSPALRIALEGWFSFIEGATLAWLSRGGLERDGLRDLLLRVLAGALEAAGTASRGEPLLP